MTTIIGVDFSGHRDDRNTWMTVGELGDRGGLMLDSAQPIRREDLFRVLNSVDTPAVVALDFPFGVPRRFAEHLCGDGSAETMADVWDVVSQLTPEEFVGIRNGYVEQRAGLPLWEREPKRAGDLRHHRESYSPLHNVNPNMVPMTYEGICLLQRWHLCRPNRWHVPPLAATGSESETVTLLELMPGALLKSVSLPFKGYKKGRDALARREYILDYLADATGVVLPNLQRVKHGCRANDDCLDSVVAAVGAAAWAVNSARFHHPDDGELADAALEGWIYVPDARRLQR